MSNNKDYKGNEVIGKEGDQLSEFIGVIKAFAERDCFPSTTLKKIIENDTVIGYEFEFVNPWYTAQPISTVYDMNLKINGKDIKQNGLSLIIRDQKIPICVAKTIYEMFWGYGEVARVFIETEQIDMALITTHCELEIEITMRTTVSYGIPNDRMALTFKQIMEVE